MSTGRAGPGLAGAGEDSGEGSRRLGRRSRVPAAREALAPAGIAEDPASLLSSTAWLAGAARPDLHLPGGHSGVKGRFRVAHPGCAFAHYPAEGPDSSASRPTLLQEAH